MANIQPYLIFNGNCEEAVKFYCSVFGGETQHTTRYKEMPQEASPQGMPENWGDKILHMNFMIRGEQLMASDSHPGADSNVGNNIQLCVNYDKKTPMDDAFNKLGQGGKITMPLQNTFWGARFGMLVDRYGNSWMFNQMLEDMK